MGGMTDEERKARYLARKEIARKQALAHVSDASLKRCLDVIKARHAAHVFEIAEDLNVAYNTIKKVINLLRQKKKIYVFDHQWVEGARTRMPIYKVGNKPDVKMQRIDTRSLRPTKRTPTCEEELARKETYKKHEAWKQTWRPHVDPAAAWMMNPVK